MIWRDIEQPAHPANQFAATFGLPASDGKPDTIYLRIGHAEPPFITGTPDQIQEQLDALPTVPIDILGKYSLTRTRLKELIDVLQQAAHNYDVALGAETDDNVSGQRG
jgi:hypothetical protein